MALYLSIPEGFFLNAFTTFLYILKHFIVIVYVLNTYIKVIYCMYPSEALFAHYRFRVSPRWQVWLEVIPL